MPRVSEFQGVVITMYVREHPPPHFHARYGDSYASIEIDTGKLIRGDLPRPQLKLVREWMLLHRSELRGNWELVRNRRSPKTISPLR
ncbi:MAG TPA: DUF4160 domain-containing protein [Solirubrobacterales bacterium]|nr:DUF4160 domain-containing protein [Solirubrobacterales bacterium]